MNITQASGTYTLSVGLMKFSRHYSINSSGGLQLNLASLLSLPFGGPWTVDNTGAGTVTVKDSGGTTVATVATGHVGQFFASPSGWRFRVKAKGATNTFYRITRGDLAIPFARAVAPANCVPRSYCREEMNFTNGTMMPIGAPPTNGNSGSIWTYINPVIGARWFSDYVQNYTSGAVVDTTPDAPSGTLLVPNADTSTDVTSFVKIIDAPGDWSWKKYLITSGPQFNYDTFDIWYVPDYDEENTPPDYSMIPDQGGYLNDPINRVNPWNTGTGNWSNDFAVHFSEFSYPRRWADHYFWLWHKGSQISTDGKGTRSGAVKGNRYRVAVKGYRMLGPYFITANVNSASPQREDSLTALFDCSQWDSTNLIPVVANPVTPTLPGTQWACDRVRLFHGTTLLATLVLPQDGLYPLVGPYPSDVPHEMELRLDETMVSAWFDGVQLVSSSVTLEFPPPAIDSPEFLVNQGGRNGWGWGAVQDYMVIQYALKEGLT